MKPADAEKEMDISAGKKGPLRPQKKKEVIKYYIDIIQKGFKDTWRGVSRVKEGKKQRGTN